MLEMNLETLISGIVNQVLLETPYKDRDIKKGLHFGFDVSLSSYVNGKEYNVRKGLHLVYYARTNYVTVFSGVTEKFFTSPKEVTEWKHEATHDSCWRDIVAFTNLYFDMAERVNEKRVIAGLKSVAPKNMEQNVFFMGFGRDVWNFIDVEIDYVDKSDSYSRKLTIL